VAKPKIGVVGGGLTGHGIAYIFASAGHDVELYEVSADVRASLPQRLRAIVELLEDDPACLERISIHDQLAPAVAGAHVVIEAAPENLEIKQKLFADLENLVA